MNSSQNMKVVFRGLKKRPAFSLVIILTIAIVTGTSIVIYSYIDALLLSPLPFKKPDRLVQIHSYKGGEQGLLSYPEFLDMQKELNLAEEIAAYRDGGRYNLSGGDQPPEELTTTFATSNLFKVLGVPPAMGDHWPATLDRRGSHTIMLTHELWQRRFSGTPEVVGLEVTLDGFPGYSNYGVMPQGFSFPGRNEAFRALAFADFVVDARDFRCGIGLARLREGVSFEQFNEELRKFARLQEERHLQSNQGITFKAEPLESLFTGNIKGYLWLLAGAALFLLIIAAVNVSNLIVSQAIRQSKTTAVRKVLGSTNLQLIKGSVVNSLFLSLTGSLLGLALSSYFIDVTQTLVSQYLPYWVSVEINLQVLLYALGLALLLGLITGLAPWFSGLSGVSLQERLKDGDNTAGSRRQGRLQQGLAMLQVTVSILLLIGGGLLHKSFEAASNARLGFDTENRLAFRIALSWYKYSSSEKIRNFYKLSTKEIAAIPGVESVAVNGVLPLSDIVKTATQAQTVFEVEGQSQEGLADNPFISVQQITPDYFELMNINLKRGSGFSHDAITSHQFQVVIDQQLADRMWPGENPVNKRIRIKGIGKDEPYLTVIGVVNDVKHQSITGHNNPSVYVSILNHTEIDAYYIVKTSASIRELGPRLRETILSIDENQPTFEYKLMDDRIAAKNWQSKVASVLFMAIAVIGSISATVGLFSIITFLLVRKIKELALRRVLGASDRNIVRLVLKDVIKIAGVGICLGLLLAPFLLRPVMPYLFEVGLFDLPVYFITSLGLAVVIFLASLSPIRRAILINPIKALRKD